MPIGTFSTFLGGAGRFDRNSSDATWAAARDATAATTTFATYEIEAEQSAGPVFRVQRVMLPVDTSSIPSGAKINATELRGNFNYEGGASNSTIAFIQTTQGSATARDVNDYNNVTFTSGGSINVTSATSTAGTITGNSTSLDWIVKAGTTLVGIISEEDLNNTTPTATDTWVTMTSPSLVVTYTVGGNMDLTSKYW